jgi:Domain of unknown function (DUF222)
MFETIHEQLTAVASDGKHRDQLEIEIGELSRVESHAAERRLALTAAIDELGDGGIDGANVTRVKARRSKKSAAKAARTAAQLKQMPRTRAALAAGRITEEHADAAADAADSTSAAEADNELAEDATRQPADMFAKQARSWAGRREQKGRKEDRQARQRASRQARMWINAEGMTCLYGEFDPIAGKVIRRAFQSEIDRLWRVDGGREGAPDDIRTPDQRGADAIHDLFTSAGGAGVSGRRPHPRYLVMVRADADRLRADNPMGTAEFLDGTPLPQSALERIACDSAFVGAVFDTDGSILWQGRTHRLATDEQWTALIGRDGGCVGCGAAPAHCEAHHLTPWAPPTNGPTDVEAMALLCSHDHHLVHDHGYALVNVNGTWRLIPPKRRASSPRGPTAEAA